MSTVLSAIFEHGVLRPTQPLALDEGAEVRLILVDEDQAATPAEILAELAALPVEGSGEPDTSRDHDLHLYGSPNEP